MGVYGYCVAPAGHLPAPEVWGFDDAPVTARTVASLVVWVSEGPRPEPTAEHVQLHNRVVEAAVTDDVTPVPLRFGQWSDEPDVFDRVVSEKAGWYRERLAAFAGALEFGLRAARPDKQTSARVLRVPHGNTGLEYMNALRASHQAALAEQADQQRVRAAVSALMQDVIREERMDEARTPHGVASFAHLVARERFEQYRARIQELRAAFPELRFLSSGPWAPYSFAV